MASDIDPTVKETTPAMLFPKSYAVAASSSKTALPDEEVRLSALLTEPLELCTESGCSVRELGARMYSAYGIAKDEEAKPNMGMVVDSFMVERAESKVAATTSMSFYARAIVQQPAYLADFLSLSLACLAFGPYHTEVTFFPNRGSICGENAGNGNE